MMVSKNNLMVKAKIGDIIEIKYPDKLYYAQYTHKVSGLGDLIQVTNHCFETRPDSLDFILSCDIRIITFTGLSVLLQDDEFEIIGNAPVPDERKKMPVFRVRGHITKDGVVKNWWFWNGGKLDDTWPSKPALELTKEQEKLPIRSIWSIDVLLKRIASGWTHDKTLGF